MAIEARKRGAPLDKVVSELMILANTSWGEQLAEKDLAGIYRVQSSGKVRLSVHAEMHEGLGVSSYSWMTSPLRRYVDLVNQWQLVAAAARPARALHAQLRGAARGIARLRSHHRALRRAPARDGALLVPALAGAGAGRARPKARCCAKTWCASTACRLRCACRRCRSSIPARACAWRVEPPDLIERTVACTWKATLDATRRCRTGRACSSRSARAEAALRA